MSKSITAILLGLLVFAQFSAVSPAASADKPGLKVGVAAVPITPFGTNRDWDGTITESGVWGEKFTDTNHNGRWDVGESFEDDAGNDALDSSSKGKYDGIYLA